MAKIIRAKNSGFCFGVKRAIDKSEEQIEKNYKAESKLYTYGPLIHNKIVTDDLEKRGLTILEDIDEVVKGDIVVVRSHGEKEQFFLECNEKEVNLVDATCPFVKKIHILAKKAFNEGKNIVIIGDKNHPEVIGINGWCNDEAKIVNSIEEAKKIEADNLIVLCQTTIKKKLAKDIEDTFNKMGKTFELINTICDATENRQSECKELSQRVDAMVVIGGKNSSNSKKLYEIAKEFCKKAYFVENIHDLPLQEVTNYNKIGVTAGASTPESVIREVIANMSEIITNENVSMEDFMEQIEESLRLPKNNEIVTGKVHQATDREVIVNLGCKKDGIIPVDEVTLEEGQTLSDLFKEGDEIQAKVIKVDDGEGGILLSKKKLEVNKHWNEISKAMEDRETILVKVVRVVNGGVIASYKELNGFIPLSQLSDRFIETADEFVGRVLEVKVVRVDQKKNRAVFSHKAVLNEERQKQIEAIWENLEVGDVVEGVVMRFTDYGAFVDIGGIDGLLHISEISWGKLKHPEEILKIGQTLNVKVLSMNEEKGKISLGLKQTVPEPWSVINEKYEIGQVIGGKVVQLKDYGAFVELEPGLDGLVHISEVAHKRVTDIGEELSLGQDVEAKILDIDTDRKRISLSIKGANPEETVEETIEVEPVTEEEVIEETL